MNRRGFLGAMLAGPWVVRSGVLMPVRPLVPPGIVVAFSVEEITLNAVEYFERHKLAIAGRDLWAHSYVAQPSHLLGQRELNRIAARRLNAVVTAWAVTPIVTMRRP